MKINSNKQCQVFMKKKILIADDENNIRKLLTEMLKEEYVVEEARDGKETLSKLATNNYDLLLLDIRMPKLNGIDVLKRIKEENINVINIVITASKDIDIALQAVKLGVFDYIIKPFDYEKLKILIKNAIKNRELENQLKSLRNEVSIKYSYGNIIGTSKKMKEIYKLINKVIDNDSTILIMGESGSGKELIAKTIHYNSKRRDGPFVAVDCGALPSNLIENELFGHEKGAFTGASSREEGKFFQANDGTLFLDEISNLAFDLQAKLLRVLQEKEYIRIGGKEKLKVNSRIISATNVDLKQAMEQNEFRKDLYYRLNVIPIKIPSLKEKKEDIPLLINFFLEKFNKEMKKQVSFKDEVYEILQNYNWPGNIRELENLIQRLVVIKSSGIAGKENLPSEMLKQTKNEAFSLENDVPLEMVEKKYIEHILEVNNWHISKSAKILGIARKTLHNKIKKFGLKNLKKNSVSTTGI